MNKIELRTTPCTHEDALVAALLTCEYDGRVEISQLVLQARMALHLLDGLDAISKRMDAFSELYLAVRELLHALDEGREDCSLDALRIALVHVAAAQCNWSIKIGEV